MHGQLAHGWTTRPCMDNSPMHGQLAHARTTRPCTDNSPMHGQLAHAWITKHQILVYSFPKLLATNMYESDSRGVEVIGRHIWTSQTWGTPTTNKLLYLCGMLLYLTKARDRLGIG